MPGANTTAQWYADNYPGVQMNPDGGVLHTTEGFGWPAYSGGAVAPTWTFLPLLAARALDVRQHFPAQMSSRALKNAPGGVQTNTLNVVQIELVGTCDPTYRTSWGGRKAGVDYVFWPDAPDWLLAEVAKRLAWLRDEHGIPVTSPVAGVWAPYPSSAGNGPQRLTFQAWENLRGWVGHQHVPENDHGDPGSLNFPRIAALATAPSPAQPPAAPTERMPPVFMVKYFDEVWLIGSDRMKDRLPDPNLVHVYQAGGTPTAVVSNADAKLVMAFCPTRPAPV